MKKHFLLFLLFTISIKAQIGINTNNPHPASSLDINTSMRYGGLKIPHIALQSTDDITTIPNPASGLLIYNTQTSGEGLKEVTSNYLYYFNDTEWKKITSITDYKEKNPDLSYIVAFGTKEDRTPCNATSGANGNFNLTNLSDVNLISSSGQLTAPKTGYYNVSGNFHFRITGNPSQDYPSNGFIAANNIMLLPMRFRGETYRIEGQGYTFVGVVYLEKGEQTSPFYWNMGANRCITTINSDGTIDDNNQAYIGKQLIVWEYVGN